MSVNSLVGELSCSRNKAYRKEYFLSKADTCKDLKMNTENFKEMQKNTENKLEKCTEESYDLVLLLVDLLILVLSL